MDNLVACVRFNDAKDKNEFVSIKEIKYHKNDSDYIKPQNVDDFENHHEYEVLWCLCDTDDCQDFDNKNCIYYKAYIICLAETLTKAREKSSRIRFRFPKKIFSPSDHSSNTSSQQKETEVFRDNLQIKLENLNRAQDTVAAKKVSAQKQLNQHAKNNFLLARKPFNNDIIDSPREIMDKDETSNQRKTSIHEDDDDDSPCPKKRSKYGEAADFNSILDKSLDYNDADQATAEEDEEASVQDRNSNRGGPFIVRPQRIVSERRLEPPDISAEEAAINLYVTPAALEIDSRDRQKYELLDNNMIYLGDGKAVNKDFWDFLKLRGDSIFLRETAELICGKYNLVNRCIKPSKVAVLLQGRSPRKALTPKKYFLIRGDCIFGGNPSTQRINGCIHGISSKVNSYSRIRLPSVFGRNRSRNLFNIMNLQRLLNFLVSMLLNVFSEGILRTQG